MIKTKEFYGRMPGEKIDSRINDFLAKDNVRYVDVKYSTSTGSYETVHGALLVYDELEPAPAEYIGRKRREHND